MVRPRFSLMHLFYGTTYVAIFMYVLRTWQFLGAILVPSILYISLLALVTLFILRRYSISRILLPHLQAMFLIAAIMLLSIGPACWWMTRYNHKGNRYPAATRAFHSIYAPIATTYRVAPEPIRRNALAYLRWWFPEGNEKSEGRRLALAFLEIRDKPVFC